MSFVWFVLGMMAGGVVSTVVLGAVMLGSRGAPPEGQDATERRPARHHVPAHRGVIAHDLRRRAPRLSGVARPRATRRQVARG